MGQLGIGTVLRTTDGIRARVVSSEMRRGDFTVFNLEIADNHNYFVAAAGSSEAAVLVHNSCFDRVRRANSMPERAELTMDEREVFRRLSEHCGIDPRLASERLHSIKRSAGRGGADNVVMDHTGNVFSPETGELLGSLTEGGARHVR